MVNGSLRVETGLRYLPFAAIVLGALAVARPPAALAEDAAADAPQEVARVRSLFRAAENAGDVETVIRDAFGEPAAAAVRSLGALAASDVGARVGAWESEAPALRDRLLLEAARRLEDTGDRTALPLLREIAAMRSLVFAHVPGCRRPVRVPVFDLAREARRAALSILQRAHESDFRDLDPEARLEWLARTGDAPGDASRLAAARRLLRGEPSDARARLRAALLRAEGRLSDSAGQLLVEAYLADRIAPEAAELRRLSVPAAQRLVQEAALQDDAAYRLAILEVARSHPAVASLAAHLDGERGRLSPRAYLERDGASAASVLARDRSASMTRSLAAMLTDAFATDALRRHAALALVHQETPEARDAVATALLSAELPPPLARKLRSWLAP